MTEREEQAITVLNTLYNNPLLSDIHRQALEVGIMAIKAASSSENQKMGHWKAYIHSAYHGNDENDEPIWREVVVYHCSECNRRTVIKENYCPNCGAKMREVEK